MAEGTTEIFKEVDKIIESSNLPDHDSVLNGVAGFALYQFYCGKVLKDESKLEKGGELLGSIFSRLSEGETTLTGHSLASGLSGLFIALSILVEDECIQFDLEENVSNFDEYLISRSNEELAIKKVDFLSQALGVVYYFTRRTPTPETHKILEKFVVSIIDASIQDELGARFLNSSGPRSGTTYDLSVAHGLSGILLILLKVYEMGIMQKEIKDFILEGVKYILHFYVPKPKKFESMFPLGVNTEDGKPQYSNMLAWCYGDMNQLALLIHVSATFQMNKWDKIIDNATKRICARTYEESLVRDSHFCHGASGVCFLYRYLFDISGNEEFLKSKDEWLKITLELLNKELEEGHYKNKETEFLEGLAGVGFVLLTELSSERLAWSKLLLM